MDLFCFDEAVLCANLHKFDCERTDTIILKRSAHRNVGRIEFNYCATYVTEPHHAYL